MHLDPNRYWDIILAQHYDGGIIVTKEELEAELAKLKSDYVRIQQDLEKLVFVDGRASSAEEQLVRLEKEMANLYKQLEALDEQ